VPLGQQFSGDRLLGTPEIMVPDKQTDEYDRRQSQSRPCYLESADKQPPATEVTVLPEAWAWVDYKNELEQWNAEVLPLLEQAGLRQPFRPAQK
jgi:hypothetical protein